MVEERFKIVHLRDNGICDILDNSQDIPTFYNDLTYNMGTAKQICDLLNQFNNEITKLRSSYNRCRNKNEALHKDWDKLWDICKEYLTEDEIIKELER